jgi:mycothiol synthase
MTIRPRPYRSDYDWDQMMALLAAAWKPEGLATVETIGGYSWWRRTPGWSRTLRLWEDEAGRLAGLTVLEPGSLEFHLHPDYQDTDLAQQILTWAEEQCRDEAATERREAELSISASDHDGPRIELLERNGYQRGAVAWYGMFRPLTGPLETSPLPEGFTVRPLELHEVPARVALVRAVWPGNEVTEAKYAEIRGLPHYHPELDLVVADPDGDLAAFAIVWLDDVNRTGNFEPVGTHLDFRRRGLGRAVILEGMRRANALGAHTACVFCHRNSEPALRLYESCGLITRRRDFEYSKRLEVMLPPM